MCGAPGLCERRRRLRGEFEVAGRSLRCLRSFSGFGLAHQRHDVVQTLSYNARVLRGRRCSTAAPEETQQLSFCFAHGLLSKSCPRMSRATRSRSGDGPRLLLQAEPLQ